MADAVQRVGANRPAGKNEAVLFGKVVTASRLESKRRGEPPLHLTLIRQPAASEYEGATNVEIRSRVQFPAPGVLVEALVKCGGYYKSYTIQATGEWRESADNQYTLIEG